MRRNLSWNTDFQFVYDFCVAACECFDAFLDCPCLPQIMNGTIEFILFNVGFAFLEALVCFSP
jgi:hypothetical protein